ncbi:MAG TPA: AsmA family protein [Terriglobales bacterium]|nr:AsmA family protein [Terriglobales bacterium]
MKRTLKIVAIVIAVLLVILIAIPLIINVNSFRPRIESEASAALGRQVSLGNLSLSLLTGSVGVDDIKIADDPAFSKSPFVTAKSLKVGVELMPLIFSKQLNVTDITLDEPQITLLKAPNGTWNFSSLGGTAAKKPEAEKSGSTPQNFSVARLQVKDGKLLVGKANSAKTQAYDKVNIEVTNFSTTSQFPFKLTAGLPGGGNADISGKAGPINAQDAAMTPFSTAVKVNNLNIGSAGFIDPASGIAGLANFDGTLNSDGSQAKAVGTFTGEKLKFSPKGTPAPVPVVIKHTVDANPAKESGEITQGDILLGKAVAHLTGTFQTQGETQVVNLKLHAPDMPVDQLEALLPALGVVLPSGSQLKGGTLSAELGITGPLDKLVITGPVRLANTKLAGFDLGSKLGALSAFTGKAASNPDTSIQNASLNARVSPEGTKADNINLTVPAIGVITGAGTVSPGGELAFRMLADLHGGVAGGLTQVAGMGSSKGIPFSISGTTSNPHFVPDVAGVAGSMAQGALGEALKGKSAAGTPGNAAAGALGGLLGKKKPK